MYEPATGPFPTPPATTPPAATPYVNPWKLWANPFQDNGFKNGIVDPGYLEDPAHPEYAFNLLLNNLNMPSAARNWLQGNLGRLYGQYTGRQAQDPSQSWFDFLKGMNIEGSYNAESPYTRGERANVYAPRMRYI